MEAGRGGGLGEAVPHRTLVGSVGVTKPTGEHMERYAEPSGGGGEIPAAGDPAGGRWRCSFHQPHGFRHLLSILAPSP